jgi:hypothetical protein
MNDEQIDTLKLAIGYIGSSDRADRHEHIARIRALLADGGKGEAVLKLEGELAVAMSIIEAMRSELNAPQAECEPRKYDPATQPGDPNFDGAEAYEAHLNAECAPREAQPVADTVRECLSDVVSHYRALYAGLAFQLNEATNTENSDDMAYWKHEIKALERMYVQAESALAAPTPERADADTAGIFQRATKRCDMGFGCDEAGVCYAEAHGEPNRCPKAEIMRFNIYGNLINPEPNGMYVRYEDHARALATPASERADADTAEAKREGYQKALRHAVDDLESGNLGSISDAVDYFKRRLAQIVAWPASQARADAGKDAALTDEQIRDIWLRETGFDEQAAPFAILEFARAILAANKEPPERAEPRALTDAEIEAGWHQTFSTSNPYCPCNLKSFTKAVRWAQHAIEQAVKERK